MKKGFTNSTKEPVVWDQASDFGCQWTETENPLGIKCNSAAVVCDDLVSGCCKSPGKPELPGRFPGAERSERSGMARIQAKRPTRRQRV